MIVADRCVKRSNSRRIDAVVDCLQILHVHGGDSKESRKSVIAGLLLKCRSVEKPGCRLLAIQPANVCPVKSIAARAGRKIQTKYAKGGTFETILQWQ